MAWLTLSMAANFVIALSMSLAMSIYVAGVRYIEYRDIRRAK